jgi:hypothetical protein
MNLRKLFLAAFVALQLAAFAGSAQTVIPIPHCYPCGNGK